MPRWAIPPALLSSCSTRAATRAVPRGTVVTPGLAAARGLGGVGRQLAALEPAGLRAQVRVSCARERQVRTTNDAAAVLAGPWPFHFREPADAALPEYLRRTAGPA